MHKFILKAGNAQLFSEKYRNIKIIVRKTHKLNNYIFQLFRILFVVEEFSIGSSNSV